jgi:hypothetical protein
VGRKLQTRSNTTGKGKGAQQGGTVTLPPLDVTVQIGDNPAMSIKLAGGEIPDLGIPIPPMPTSSAGAVGPTGQGLKLSDIKRFLAGR